jgi:hypothetical protein
MYGAIDRIGSGEIGTLLDRYSDRFGHELDREIIVMRRAEHESRREATPTVEVISTPDDVPNTDDVDDELATWLNEVEDLLRPLQQAYKSTDDATEKKRLAPSLKALIAERKALLSVISGDEDEDILEELPERPQIPDVIDSAEEITSDEDKDDDGTFSEFCDMINNLLGKMPEVWINQFMSSESFSLFQSVATNPDDASDDERAAFFTMIDGELVSMPSDMLSEFMASPEFELYKLVGEQYAGE